MTRQKGFDIVPSAAVRAREGMTGSIFINYRRGDDSAVAGRLFDRLEQTFSADRLFIDVDNIAPGLDFVRELEKQVASCDVMLSIIGRHWLDLRDDSGERRIDNPDDFVRIEIETAISLGKILIPVLVNDAQMPPAHQLPACLKPLARRNAVRLTHERFRADALSLIKVLERKYVDLEAARSRTTSEDGVGVGASAVVGRSEVAMQTEGVPPGLGGPRQSAVETAFREGALVRSEVCDDGVTASSGSETFAAEEKAFHEAIEIELAAALESVRSRDTDTAEVAIERVVDEDLHDLALAHESGPSDPYNLGQSTNESVIHDNTLIDSETRQSDVAASNNMETTATEERALSDTSRYEHASNGGAATETQRSLYETTDGIDASEIVAREEGEQCVKNAKQTGITHSTDGEIRQNDSRKGNDDVLSIERPDADDAQVDEDDGHRSEPVFAEDCYEGNAQERGGAYAYNVENYESIFEEGQEPYNEVIDLSHQIEESLSWALVCESGTEEDLQIHIEKFADGETRPLALKRLAEMVWLRVQAEYSEAFPQSRPSCTSDSSKGELKSYNCQDVKQKISHLDFLENIEDRHTPARISDISATERNNTEQLVLNLNNRIYTANISGTNERSCTIPIPGYKPRNTLFRSFIGNTSGRESIFIKRYVGYLFAVWILLAGYALVKSALLAYRSVGETPANLDVISDSILNKISQEYIANSTKKTDFHEVFDPVPVTYTRNIVSLYGNTKADLSYRLLQSTNPLYETLENAISKCWFDQLSYSGLNYRPEVKVEYNIDGSIASGPNLINPPQDHERQVMALSALDAVRRCSPLSEMRQFISDYSLWKSLILRFQS